MQPEERFVRDVLDGDGFETERIDEDQHEKRADFRARHGGEVYLIEVKRSEETLTLPGPNEVAHWEIPLGYRNAVAGVTRDASRQLASTPVTEGDPLRVLWFVTTGVEADAYAEQVRATLYGAVDLIWRFQDGGAKAKCCYFFTFAEFFRRPELDAAVVGTSRHAQFCVNSFGRRVELVRQCNLYRLFESGVVDPHEEEARGTAFTADFPGNRRDEAAMLEGVKQKYKLDFLIPFKPTKYTATAWVGTGEPEGHEPR